MIIRAETFLSGELPAFIPVNLGIFQLSFAWLGRAPSISMLDHVILKQHIVPVPRRECRNVLGVGICLLRQFFKGVGMDLSSSTYHLKVSQECWIAG